MERLCDELKNPYQGYREVFVKEIAFRFKTFMDNLEDMIPSDYIHTFLIRNPHGVMPSFYKMYDDAQLELKSDDSYAEIEQIYKWITETKGYEPFVMDADDLQRDPETVLKGFCRAMGIDYQDTMVNWTPIPEDCMEKLKPYELAFKTAMESDKFLPSTPKPVLVEPSVKQYYLGEEAIDPKLKPGEDPYPNCKWKDLYDKLNQPHEGYREVFVTEMPFRFRNFLDNLEELISSNYIHAFLIRNPYRTIPSLYSLLQETNTPVASEVSWKEFEEVYNWITETKGYQPHVIDADELQKDPEAVLRHFCQAIDIDYQDTMVNWTPIPEDSMEHLKPFQHAFKLAICTNKFLPSTPNALAKDDELSEDVKTAITNAMPYYLKFKERSSKSRI